MEPISLLLDTFIELANRIIKLEKTKREDKQQVYKEIVEPLFIQLQPVADNYIAIFRRARQSVINNLDNDLSQTLDEIRELREKMQLTRSIVTTMAMQIYEMYEDRNISEFALRIMYFFEASLEGQTSEGTKSTKLVEMIERVMSNRAEKWELVDYIKGTLRWIEHYWSEIGGFYAKVKIDSLSAPKLIKKKK